MRRPLLFFAILATIGILAIFLWLVIADKRSASDYRHQVEKVQQLTISDATIHNYIADSHIAAPSANGTVFVAFHKILEEKLGTQATEYGWVMIQEYKMHSDVLEKGMGVSLPFAMYFVEGIPKAINVPREGSLYNQDLKRIFPASVIQLPIFTDVAEHNRIVEILRQDVEQQANAYFKVPEHRPTPMLQEKLEETSTTTATTTQ